MNLKSFKKKNKTFILLILVFSCIFLLGSSSRIQHIFRYLPYFCVINLILFFVYIILYHYLGLNKNIYSFIRFLFNVLIISLYLYMLYKLLIDGLKSIFLEDYSHFSALRHLLTLSLILIAGLSLLVSRYVKKTRVQHFLDKISHPWLKEEIQTILITREYTFWGPFFKFIMQKTTSNIYWKVGLFSVYFLFEVILPVTSLVFLISFTFFQGNLIYIFYLVPLFLMNFIYKNLWFYFLNFIEKNHKEVREIIVIESPYQQYLTHVKYNIIQVNLNLIKVSLTTEIQEEFKAKGRFLHVNGIRDNFFLLIQFDCILYHFEYIKKYITPLLSILRICCSIEIIAVILFEHL